MQICISALVCSIRLALLFTLIKTDSFFILRLKLKKKNFKKPGKYQKHFTIFVILYASYEDMKKKFKKSVNFLAFLVQKLKYCRYLKDIF